MDEQKSTADDKLITAESAKRQFSVNLSTDVIYKWMRVGIFARGDRFKGKPRIKLRSTSEGGRVYTTVAWVKEFKASLNGGK